jgi:hypothetical protein
MANKINLGHLRQNAVVWALLACTLAKLAKVYFVGHLRASLGKFAIKAVWKRVPLPADGSICLPWELL